MAASLDSPLVLTAVNALLHFTQKNSKKSSQQLIEDAPKYILAQYQLLSEIQPRVLKPVRIAIPHTLFAREHDNSVCLFVRTIDLKVIEDYFIANPSMYVTKVLSMDQVIKLFKDFKDKKKLLSQHTMFLCDSRIMSQLYNNLGRVFGNRHNYPIPIDIEKIEKINYTVDKAVCSTYVHLSGTNLSIRFGHTGMSAEDVTANVIAGFHSTILKLGHGNPDKGFKRIHSIHLKTAVSAALPIYSKMPSDVMKYVKTLTDGKVALIDDEIKHEKKNKKKVKKEVEDLEMEVVAQESRKLVSAEDGSSKKRVNKKKRHEVDIEEAEEFVVKEEKEEVATKKSKKVKTKAE